MFKNLANEFKKFAMRGNVIDMAVGIIIGAAFGKIVDSLVKDVIMPPIGLLLGKVDFTNLFLVLKEGATPAPYNSLAAAQEAGAVTMNLGVFVNAVISFLIVAFAVFILIKAINELQSKMDYIKAICLGKLYNNDSLRNHLEFVIQRYPTSPIDTAATALLDALKQLNQTKLKCMFADLLCMIIHI